MPTCLQGICYSETKKKNSSSLTLTPGDNDPVHDVDSPLDMVRFALLQLSTMQLSSEQQPYGQSITTMLQVSEAAHCCYCLPSPPYSLMPSLRFPSTSTCRGWRTTSSGPDYWSAVPP